MYTAIFGDYDTPRAVKPEEGVEYVLYRNDVDKKVSGWDVMDGCGLFPRRFMASVMAREVKVLQPTNLRSYDWYLWIDGSFQIQAPIMPLIEKLLKSKHDFAAFKHPEWQCSYKEIEACLARRKEYPIPLRSTRRLLERMKFPRNFGQLASGVLFRKGTRAMRHHAVGWWEDMNSTTMRDQCTFMLNLWERDAYIEWIPGSHLKNKWFKYHRGHL